MTGSHMTRRCLSSLVAAACLLASAFSEVSAAADGSEPLVRVTKSRLKLDPALERAYTAFQAGELAAAERDYALALKSEPNNSDALNGAAAVALRKNERERAEIFYRRAVAANPRDAAAQAGLAGLRSAGDPLATESRLKELMALQPDEPSLLFALGVAHAAANRWRDAQQAFFGAYAGDPDRPDYLFNLAVSLDHLHQAPLARRFYEKALSAAARHPAAFDLQQAAARLRELAP